jgi:hypothetical protein
MRMIRKSMLMLALGSVLAGSAVVSYAQQGPKPEGEKPELQQDALKSGTGTPIVIAQEDEKKPKKPADLAS